MSQLRFAVAMAIFASTSLTSSSASANEQSLQEFKLGQLSLANKDPAAALAHFERALQIDPASGDGQLGRAVYYRREGKLDLALKDIDEVIRLNPSRPSAWQTRAEIQYDAGKYDEAVKDATRAWNTTKKATAALYTRGNSYLQLGKLDDALRDLDEVVNLMPNLPRPLVSRAKVHAAAGRFAEAIADLEKAVSIDPRKLESATALTDAKSQLAEAYLDQRPGFSQIEDNPANIGRLSSELDAIASELDLLQNTSDNEPRLAVIQKRLDRRQTGMLIFSGELSTAGQAYRSRVNEALTLVNRKLGETRAAAVLAVVDAAIAALSERGDAAVQKHAAAIDSLGISGDVLDSRIMLIGPLNIGDATPWITLRQWIGIVIDAGEYRIVDSRVSEDQKIWTLSLKKPSHPVMILGFRFDYGDIFPKLYGEGDQVTEIDSQGVRQLFETAATRAVGFEW